MSEGKDEEILRVARELDALLDELQANVDALSAILLPPEADPDKERVVTS